MTLDAKIGVGLLVVIVGVVLVGSEARAYASNGAARVTFSKFVSQGSPEFAEADVLLDGNKVGVITRCKNDEFVSESSRARKWIVTSYEVLMDDTDDDADATFDVDSNTTSAQALRKAQDYCRRKLGAT